MAIPSRSVDTPGLLAIAASEVALAEGGEGGDASPQAARLGSAMNESIRERRRVDMAASQMRGGDADGNRATAALLGLIVLAWAWRPLTASAVTAASYGARVACPCRFIAGRTLQSCREEIEPGLGWVMLSDDDQARSITARIPLLAKQTATFRPGDGCQLEKWGE
jgi:hypothetical protein